MLEVIAFVLIALGFLAVVVCLVRSNYPRFVKLTMFFTFATAMALFMGQAYKAYVGMQNEKNAHPTEESTHTSSEKSCDCLHIMMTDTRVIQSCVTHTDSTIDIHLLLKNQDR